ncbi:MAG: type IV pilin protein, partial [Ideonella sp.]
MKALDRSRSRRRTTGWTLVELMIGLALTAILTSLSYPSFRSIILRIHRGDALASLGHVQMQQQRYRSNRPSFATLSELGVATTTASGRYRLEDQAAPTAAGFLILASALGTQAADLPCTHLLLEVSGADTRMASGPDSNVSNGESENLR